MTQDEFVQCFTKACTHPRAKFNMDASQGNRGGTDGKPYMKHAYGVTIEELHIGFYEDGFPDPAPIDEDRGFVAVTEQSPNLTPKQCAECIRAWKVGQQWQWDFNLTMLRIEAR